MENKTSTENKIQFSIKATLLACEKDEMLDEVFREFVSLDYPKLHKMNDGELLNDTVKGHIKGMFMFVIKNKSSLDVYEMFYNRIGDDQDDEFTPEPEVKETKKPNRPRVRINKANVMKAKEKSKDLSHDGALATLRLKNLHPRLERAYANETLHGEPLGDDKWLKILGVIETTEKKINQILKGK